MIGNESGGQRTIGVMTVATNRYVDYWRRMAVSADEHLFPGHRVVLHVFTDRPEEARAAAAHLERVEIDAVEIPPYTWPEATLLRYEVFAAHRDRLTEDVLIHLDADMLVVDDVGPALDPAAWNGGIALVRHPGFRRPPMPHRLAYYARHPRRIVADLRTRSRLGALGSWEQGERSRAFVPRKRRDTYVCGGTWMGRGPELLTMIGELAERTRADLDEGTIAVWHDESHLNWYASHHPHTVLSSEYCYALGWDQLSDLEPLIVAVEKGDERTR